MFSFTLTTQCIELKKSLKCKIHKDSKFNKQIKVTSLDNCILMLTLFIGIKVELRVETHEIALVFKIRNNVKLTWNQPLF